MAEFTLTDDQEVDVALDLLDQHGNPAKAFNVPEWTVTDPAILDVKANPDGLSAVVGAVGKTGSAQVSVRVQRSTDPNDVLTGVQDFVVVGGAAATIGLVEGGARSRTTPLGPQGPQGPQV
jgi:hypothetical protein